MKFSLRPSEAAFYDMFSRAAKNLVKGCVLLTELALPGADVQSVSERLEELEHDPARFSPDPIAASSVSKTGGF